MMVKDYLFLQVSNVLGRGVGLGRHPSNDDEGISVSAVFKCFRKWVWGWGGGPLIMVKDSLFLQISNVFGKGPTTDGEGLFVSADFNYFRKGAH